jgi:hypothetical protein
MKKPTLLKEEILYYLKEEEQEDFKKHKENVWLTTRGFQKRLEARGILISWTTLNLKLMNLLVEGKVEKIKTTSGECWKPSSEGFRI